MLNKSKIDSLDSGKQMTKEIIVPINITLILLTLVQAIEELYSQIGRLVLLSILLKDFLISVLFNR